MNPAEEKSLFSKQEAAELSAALATVLPEGSDASFDQLVYQYRLFVHSVDGYAFTIYDYDNDLSVRESLDRALQSCSAELREKAQASLQKLDDQFLQETVAAERKYGPNCEDCSFNWYSRLPRNPGDTLKEDIEAWNF